MYVSVIYVCGTTTFSCTSSSIQRLSMVLEAPPLSSHRYGHTKEWKYEFESSRFCRLVHR